MTTKIEQVARALRNACLKEFGSDWNNDIAMNFARVALEAMKEPTIDMMVAGMENWRRKDDAEEDVDAIFNAMIQSAIDEE